MKHLESKREAVERRRISLMSTGVAKFLEWTARLTELDVDSNSEGGLSSAAGSGAQSSCPDVTVTTSASDTGRDEWQEKRDAPEIVLDSIKVTLDRAAQILRESLELTSGGVIFLDTAIGPAEPRDDDDYFGLDIDPDVTTARTGGNAVVPPYASPNLEPDLTMTGIIPDIAMSAGAVRGSRDEYRPARTPALSCSKNAYERSKVLDGKTLQKFIDVYPKGNVWYIDAKGYFFSLDQMDDIYRDPAKASIWEGRGSVEYTVVDVARQRAEAALLSEVFQDARQIIFLPLWDARSSERTFPLLLTSLIVSRSLAFWVFCLEQSRLSCLHRRFRTVICGRPMQLRHGRDQSSRLHHSKQHEIGFHQLHIPRVPQSSARYTGERRIPARFDDGYITE